ncbi:SRPBCC family protein [Ornithinimicrobium tianjinense]|uniref:Activator of HSP90 ATPase n=1 Tax=Ornithinimicrobium tianjinense TaxID=1195761 RepID=A0A917BXA8_9MICO|nr:SRPBCC family protein [Ornithinimicrobium tianjinense]GGF58398.1 activator of HSP90 ATPase [Ornithinimicrobium tianjinense]
MKDLLEELRRTDRTVADGEVAAGPAKVVVLARTYDADVEDVWDALTDPERLPRWFLPVSGELRPGGRFQVEGNAGGVVRACEPPRRLLVTWEMGPPSEQDASLVEVRLAEADGGTRLELEHRAQVPPEMWDQFGPGAVGVGWDGALLGLGLHLAGHDLGLTPEQLGTDPAIRAFNTESAQAWGRAHRAAGGDTEAVAAMVAATTGFYVPPLES